MRINPSCITHSSSSENSSVLRLHHCWRKEVAVVRSRARLRGGGTTDSIDQYLVVSANLSKTHHGGDLELRQFSSSLLPGQPYHLQCKIQSKCQWIRDKAEKARSLATWQTTRNKSPAKSICKPDGNETTRVYLTQPLRRQLGWEMKERFIAPSCKWIHC